jgi:hypothetical protein
VHIHEQSLQAQLEGGWRYLNWPVIPYVGIGASAVWTRQQVSRVNEQQVEQIFGVGPLPDRLSFGVGPLAVAGIEVPLPRSFVLMIQGQGALLHAPRDSSASGPADWAFVAGGAALVGWQF